eukprot:CAMPEP_0172155894 /NCGR_PEP_ID=MMETSP1050-20130122/2887_1 /TAXON_ID=233186 /ORGANISM="Cryptomonas curvata, Strain CCAP979/52" /LENGTH=1463 /DNA_ID=CAMNT_0012824859 /DNA_START=66 /DNA_END=4457 /DNA_ORIENTATION=+
MSSRPSIVHATLILSSMFIFVVIGDTNFAILPSNGPKSGKNIIALVSGTPLFSRIDSSPMVRIGGSSCEATVWFSETRITCIVPSGSSSAAGIVISVGFLSLGNLYPVELDSIDGNQIHYTYDKAVISSESLHPGNRSNIPRSLGQTLLIVGNNFGIFDLTVKGSVGLTSCESSIWSSDTSLSCKVVASTEKSTPFLVTITNEVIHDCKNAGVNDTDSMSCANAFSFDRFSIESTFPFNGVSGGGWMVTIAGRGFGTVDTTVKVRLMPLDGNKNMESDCAISTWMSDTSVFCLMPRGDSAYLGVSLTVSKIQGTRASCLSYNNFKLIEFSPKRASNAGEITMSILGTSFGYSPTKARSIRLGDTACTSSSWTSDSAMSCLVSRGYGRDLFTTITIDYASNPYLDTDQGDERLYFSYDSPQIEKLADPNANPKGGSTVTIIGSSFGVWDLSPITMIGDTACPKTDWISSSSLLAKVPEYPFDNIFQGSTLDVQLFVGTQVAISRRAFAYDVACKPGPCVAMVSCREGCNGSNTEGDHRHSRNKVDRFMGVNVARIIGNFTLGGSRLVTVGNVTSNTTRLVTERPCYGNPCLDPDNVGISVIFGGLFTCEVLADSEYNIESFIDCVMPAGIGSGYPISLTIRNASYKAIVDGCTPIMRQLGTQIWDGKPFGTCFLPSNFTKFFSMSGPPSVVYGYSRPQIFSLRPSTGPNMVGKTANVTITGAGFGRAAVAQWRGDCAGSNLTVCKSLFSNTIVVFNSSCDNVDLLLSRTQTGGDVESVATNQNLAFCSSANALALTCKYAFRENPDLCLRPCLQDWNPACTAVCPEDKLICQMPVLGGVQVITVVIGGVSSIPSQNATFRYNAPRLQFVLPPELEMGKSSLLTVIGTNFGAPLAIQYAGRNSRIAFEVELFSPYNASSLTWWDVAQYLTCFSGFSNSGNVTDMSMSSIDRKCDLGVVLSNQIEFFNSWASDTSQQQLIVQSPTVQGGNGGVVQSVDIFVQSVGVRSSVTPIYGELVFRRACRDVRANLGDMISLWYLGAGDSAIVQSLADGRKDFAAVSYGGRIIILGGSSRTTDNLADAYQSSIIGASGWELLSFPEYLPRWSPRVNLTAVVFADILFILGGRTRDGSVCYNDVWVFVQDKATEAKYHLPGTQVQYEVFGDGFQPYFILITSSAPWAPRSKAQAVVFQNKVWLLGGLDCRSQWQIDLWSSEDMTSWTLVHGTNSWYGRNNIVALVHNSRIWVLASVENQFYNTYYTTDGIIWKEPNQACALTLVDVQTAVSLGQYMILFTMGCHNLGNQVGEEEVPCSSGINGTNVRTQNRIYYSKDGATWLLARNPYNLDQNSNEPVSRAVPFQSRDDNVPGGNEFRWGYSVVVHSSLLYLIGGQQVAPYRETVTGAIINEGALQLKCRMDVWVSSGLFNVFKTCLDSTKTGLSSSMIQNYIAGSTPCRGYFTIRSTYVSDP